MTIITKELKKKIAVFYLSEPKTLKDVQKEFNLSQPTVSKILNEYNCRRYTKAEINNPNFIQDYFSKIDTEFKAYFLGLLITDGCVHKPNNGRQASISITLKKSDSYILDLLKEEIKTNTNIVIDKRNCANLSFRSNKMAEDLAKYGVVPRKTTTTYLPKIDEGLMHHLLRGILDGDGNIQSHLGSNNKHRHQIGYCGTPQLMLGIKEHLNSIFNLSNRKIYNYNNTFSEVCWNSIEDVYNIGTYLYNEATIYMIRKNDLFKDFVKHYQL